MAPAMKNHVCRVIGAGGTDGMSLGLTW